MKDGIGNNIDKGNYLYWKSKDMIVKVVDVVEPTLEGNTAPPSLVIMMQIPIMGVERGKEPMLGEFLRTVDPLAEQMIDKMIKQ